MVVEFLADKFPYIDSVWDGLQAFISIPAGALLAMGAINSNDPLIASLVAILGASLTGITHATKASGRALINTTPEPATNITTSVVEDGVWLAGGWLALVYPMLFLGILLIVMLWLLPKIWRGLRSIFLTPRKKSSVSER
jgi:Domain of unknown function (DUF4126)